MNDDLTTQRTPEIIAAEIRGYTGMMLSAAIEIGRRFCEVKELLPHGDFMPWVEQNTGYKQSSVNQYMQLYRAYGDKALNAGYEGLTLTKAAALLSLPEPERDAFVQEHPVEDMTTKELKKALRERDEALAERDRARRDEAAAQLTIKAVSGNAERDRAEAERLRVELNSLKNEPKEVYRDETAIEAAAKQATEAADKAWTEKLTALNAALDKANAAADEAKAALVKAEDKAKKAQDKLKTADENAAKRSAAELDAAQKAAQDAHAEAEKLRVELEAAKDAAAKAKIAGDGDLALVRSYAEELIGYANKLNGVRKKALANGNAELAEKVGAILKSVAAQIGGLA